MDGEVEDGEVPAPTMEEGEVLAPPTAELEKHMPAVRLAETVSGSWLNQACGAPPPRRMGLQRFPIISAEELRERELPPQAGLLFPSLRSALLSAAAPPPPTTEAQTHHRNLTPHPPCLLSSQ